MSDGLDTEVEKFFTVLVRRMYKEKADINCFTHPVLVIGSQLGGAQGVILIETINTEIEETMKDENLFKSFDKIAGQMAHTSGIASIPFILSVAEFHKGGKRYIAAESSNWKSENSNKVLEITKGETEVFLTNVDDKEKVLSDSIVRKMGGLFWNSYIKHQLE